MKWSTVKNMMLVLLIVMNVFILGSAVAKRLSSERIPPLVNTAAIQALENSDIIYERDLLPEKYLTMRTFTGRFPTAMELSRMFFGEQLAFQTEERTLIARQDGAELRVEDEYFSYSSGLKAVDSEEKELRKALSQLGLDMSHAVFGGGEWQFNYMYGNRPVFGMYIRASLTEDGQIAQLEASWPTAVSPSARRTGISIIGCIPDILERFTDGGAVTGLEAGYSSVRNENTDFYSFEPSWRITMENGDSEIFMD